MANSINPNYGAIVALQNLNATNRALETTQNRIDTGFKVASAKDNGAISSAFLPDDARRHGRAGRPIQNSIQRGRSVLDVRWPPATPSWKL